MKYYAVRKNYKQRKTMMCGLKITMTALGRSVNATEDKITVVGDILEKQSKNLNKKNKIMFTMREKMIVLENRLGIEKK